MTSTGTTMTTTAIILRFSEVLRLFKAFFFDMAATNSRSHLYHIYQMFDPSLLTKKWSEQSYEILSVNLLCESPLDSHVEALDGIRLSLPVFLHHSLL
jgi:hypothetical protein